MARVSADGDVHGRGDDDSVGALHQRENGIRVESFEMAETKKQSEQSDAITFLPNPDGVGERTRIPRKPESFKKTTSTANENPHPEPEATIGYSGFTYDEGFKTEQGQSVLSVDTPDRQRLEDAARPDGMGKQTHGPSKPEVSDFHTFIFHESFQSEIGQRIVNMPTPDARQLQEACDYWDSLEPMRDEILRSTLSDQESNIRA